MIQVEANKDRVDEFKDKNILIIGLARSGTGAANLLSLSGARVTVTDRKPLDSLENQIKMLLPAVKVIAGGTPDEVIESADMIVVSPGVPLDSPFLVRARRKETPLIGELELAYRAIRSAASYRMHRRGERPFPPASPEIIGITGTNGKSTTTTLVDRMLKDSNYKTILGGNIGSALTEELLKAGFGCPAPGSEIGKPDYIVTEISSFQLESIKEFRPGIASILNITADHLDRYDSMDDYISAKARIFENQTSDDFLIVNADDPLVVNMIREQGRIRKKGMPRILYFSREKEVRGIYCKDGIIRLDLSDCEISQDLRPCTAAGPGLIKARDMKIKGAHNLENAMAASLMALIAGCRHESVEKTLKNFSGLEHRLEIFCEAGGIRFINDSKGTNVNAVARSLEGFDNIILIMGGLDKGDDFSVLSDLIGRKVKLLLLIGQAQEKIAQAVGSMTETYRVPGLREAVALAVSKASSGDVVMLSPGCASFDMFDDFEDRGRKFKEVVREIINAQ